LRGDLCLRRKRKKKRSRERVKEEPSATEYKVFMEWESVCQGE